MRGRAAWGVMVLACAALAGGCATERAQRDLQARNAAYGLTLVRDLHERSMQQAWVGRPRSELVADLGRPVALLGMPGSDRIPPSLILVYTKPDSPGGCIDAFVVLQGEQGQVWNYFCR